MRFPFVAVSFAMRFVNFYQPLAAWSGNGLSSGPGPGPGPGQGPGGGDN